MIKKLETKITTKVKSLVKEIASSQGGAWVEKKNLRCIESSNKTLLDFNPKTARTRTF